MRRFIPELKNHPRFHGYLPDGTYYDIWDGKSTRKTPAQCEEYRQKWKRESQESQEPDDEPTKPGRIPLCIDRGGLTTPPEGVTKGQWVVCNDPTRPLKTKQDPTGEKVCGCVGCGPNCTGYKLTRKPTIVVNHRAEGLGDAILGMLPLGSLKADNPDHHIIYRHKPSNFPFLQLFHGGFDELRPTDAKEDCVLPGDATSGERQINRHYQKNRHKEAPSVWERYRMNIGASGIKLPTLREPDKLKSLGKEWRGAIVLHPFSTCNARNWRIESWQTLVNLLQQAGHRCIAIDNQPDRIKPLRCEKLTRLSAEKAVALLLNCGASVCVESGIAHLSGVLGTRTVVLCGPTTGESIHGAYERVVVLQGKLHCDGCWWNKPYDKGRCDLSCASLQSILPSEVLNEVNRFYKAPTRAPSFTLIIPTVSEPTLRRTLDSLVGQPWNPGDEILLVGDGKQPEAREIWREYKDRLPGEYHEYRGPNYPLPGNKWGHDVRNAERQAKGSHLLALDADDTWVENALAVIRRAVTDQPDRPHLFRMREGTNGPISKNIGTPMLVEPNDPARWVEYGMFYGGDEQKIERTCAFYPDGAVQHEEVICIVNP